MRALLPLAHGPEHPLARAPGRRRADADRVRSAHAGQAVYGDAERAKREAVAATIASIDSVLAEPLAGCVAQDADANPCLEALTPVELESELAMPGGHIFHRDLAWPFAESGEQVGTWGVETAHANVWLCGAGARRGGCVSGIAGHNAARAVLTAR